MQVVDDAGDAGVDATERGHQVSDVHVVRPIERCKALVSSRHVIPDQAVGNDLTERCGPGVAVTVDESRDDDRARGINDLRPGRWPELTAHLNDVFPLDMEVAPNEVAECGVHRNDGSAAQKNVVIRIDGRPRRASSAPPSRLLIGRCAAPRRRTNAGAAAATAPIFKSLRRKSYG